MKIIMIIIAFLFSTGAVAAKNSCQITLPSECLEILDSRVSSSQVNDVFDNRVLLRLQVNVKCKVDVSSEVNPNKKRRTSYKEYHFVKIINGSVDAIGIDFFINNEKEYDRTIYDTFFYCGE